MEAAMIFSDAVLCCAIMYVAGRNYLKAKSQTAIFIAMLIRAVLLIFAAHPYVVVVLLVMFLVSLEQARFRREKRREARRAKRMAN